MKKILFMLIWFIAFSNMANATMFHQGDSGTLSFLSLPFIGTGSTTYDDVAWIKPPPPTIIFREDGSIDYVPFLTQEDSFQIDLFENQDDLIPSYVEIISGLYGTPVGIGFSRSMSFHLDGTVTYGDLLWEDLEGKLTLTMLSGSMNLDFLNIEVHAGGQVWGQSCEFSPSAPVPEPATMLLFGTGIVGLVSVRLKNNKQQTI